MLNAKLDKRLISALLSYDPLAAMYEVMGANDDRKRRYVAEHAMPRETLKELIAAGMAFEFGRLTHDDAVERSFSKFGALQKNRLLITSCPAYQWPAPIGARACPPTR